MTEANFETSRHILIAELAARFAPTNYVEDFLKVAPRLKYLLDFRRCVLAMSHPGDAQLEYIPLFDVLREPSARERFQQPPNRGLAGYIWILNEPRLFNAFPGDQPDGFQIADPLLENGRMQSIIACPARVRNKVVGVLLFGMPEPWTYERSDLEMAAAVANLVGPAIDRWHLLANLNQRTEKLEDAIRQLRETQAELVHQESLKAMGQMASGIAHDFNNSLALIQGYLEYLSNIPDLANREPYGQALADMNTATSDAATVVRRLRALYHAENPDEEYELVDLKALALETLNLTKPRWKAQAQVDGKFIEMDSSIKNVPLIRGNPAELREILTNLIFNAVDAIGEKGAIQVGTSLVDQHVSLQISDDGAGMSEETQQKCFEPYYTTKGQDGTGLGLAMVARIIEQHGGTIDLRSTEGAGTVFNLRFPVIDEDRSEPALESDSTTEPTRMKGLAVLVVEDERPLRNLIESAFERLGHHCVTAAHGREGLERMGAAQFDIIFTDRAMPELNGDQFAAALDQQQQRPPVIMLTGYASLMKAAGDKPRGVDLIISKPFSSADLQTAIEKVFAQDRGKADG